MAVNLAPIGNDAPFVDASGNPLSGGLLYTYTAGSSTPQNTYTTAAGSVANANPIVLNSNGYPASGGSVVEIWLTAGVSYKFILQTSAGVTVWTRDDIDGINDTSVTSDQWVAGPTPTYIGATSFSLVGDQTSTFQVGRRLKTTNSGGTIYSTITASAYGALTTVTVVNDSGTLDSGLSAVSYGLLSASNPSTPLLTDAYPIVSGSADKTKKLRIEVDGFTTATTRAATFPDADITVARIDAAQTFQSTQSFAGLINISGAAAGQIQFPATQNASADVNTLDDYEEGTWTPSIGGNATYTTQIGTYTKVGRLVTIQMYLVINVIGTGSQTTISGLPFTANTSGATYTVCPLFFSGASTNYTNIVGLIQNNTATIQLFGTGAAATALSSTTAMTSGTSIGVTCSYIV